METKVINTTPAGLRALLSFAREPYRSESEDQVCFEDLSRLRRLDRLLEGINQEEDDHGNIQRALGGSR